MSKATAKAMPTIGTYSFYWFYGLLIKAIEYGIEDYVLFVEEVDGEVRGAHRCKVYYGNRPYFRFNGERVYFDDILRTA